MDSLINYPDFVRDIQDNFADLIKEFDFKFEQIYEGRYVLKGLHCTFIFNYDRGDVFCDMMQSVKTDSMPDNQINHYSNAGHSVWSIFKYLYPADTTFDKPERIYDARLQLIESAAIASLKLKSVIEGDFSWFENFLEKTNRKDRLLRFILSLGRFHPVAQKFWRHDPMWEQDLEKYLSDNHIVL